MSEEFRDSDEYNQCDGCMAGMDLKEGNLHTDYDGNAVMVCQADRYRVGQGGMSKLSPEQLKAVYLNFTRYRDQVCNGNSDISVHKFYERYGLASHDGL